MKIYNKNVLLIMVTIIILPYVLTIMFEGGINFAKEEKANSEKTVVVNDNNVQMELDIEQYVIGVSLKLI
ncbi:hypothetical protein CG709_17735 [Lachnotalea glycerini]|nr:hypothetical protein CG709_17735 [Lachnotalea glycerini]